jgi:hypothetical protein
MRSSRKVLIAALAFGLIQSGWALADFTPKFKLRLTELKSGASTGTKIHLEFDENDEEIGTFTLRIPAGFKVAPDGGSE